MKNRLISILLAAIFVLTLIPAGALCVSAASDELQVVASRFKDKNAEIYIKNNTSSAKIFGYCLSATSIDNGNADVAMSYFTVAANTTDALVVSNTTNKYLYWNLFSNDSAATEKRQNLTAHEIGQTTDSKAPKISNVSAVRIGESISLSFTSDEDGEFWYSTANTTADKFTSKVIMSDGENSTRELYLGTTYTKIYYYAKDALGNKTSVSTVNIDSFSIALDSTAASTAKFNCSASVSGKLYYEFSDGTIGAQEYAKITNAKNLSKGNSSVQLSGRKSNLYYYFQADNGAKTLIFSVVTPGPSTTTHATVKDILLRREEGYATLTVQKETAAGTFYYGIYDKKQDKNPEKSALTSQKAMTAAAVCEVTVSDLDSKASFLYYYTADAEGTYTSDVAYVEIPAFAKDEEKPAATLIKTSYSGNKVTLSFTASEAGYVKYSIGTPDNDSAYVKDATSSVIKGSNALSATFSSNAKDQKVVFTFTLVDAFGNESAEKYRGYYNCQSQEAPVITNLYVTHPLAKYAYIYFTADVEGTLCIYQTSDTVSNGISTNKSNPDKISFDTGFNTIPVLINTDEAYTLYVNFANKKGDLLAYTEYQKLTIGKYSSSDTSLITISSVTKSNTSSYVKGETGVTLTVKASSAVIKNPTFEYSFDGGSNWQTANTYKLTESQTLAAGTIKVRVFGDTTSANWASYNTSMSITNIDNKSPRINTIRFDPEDATKLVKTLKITIDATDEGSGSGIASGIEAYSFDGGKTWQVSATKEYKDRTELPAGSLQVKDKVGNITKYNTALSLQNVDSTPPSYDLFEIKQTRPKLETGTIRLTASEAGKFCYFIGEYIDGDVIELEMVEGENVFNINGLEEYVKGNVIVVFYLVDEVGNQSKVFRAYIPEYGADDKVKPVIKEVKISTKDPTNKPVEITVDAEDAVELHEKAYSFDGGDTWQKSNVLKVEKNRVFNKGSIKVRDAAENITAYEDEIIEITNIDTNKPYITVKSAASGNSVVLTITATDDVALAAAAYSFNGGESWQAANTLTLAQSQIKTFAAGTIQVKDKAGNVTGYQYDITAASLTALIGGGNVTPPSDAWTNPYRDVAPSSWYYTYVKSVSQMGLFQGVSSTEFGPDVKMTRAMFVTVLGRLEGIDTTQYNKSNTGFNDVKAGQWYSPYIIWASENHIVNGKGNGIFDPDGNITREQMCLIIYNYLFAYKKYESQYSAKTVSFADKAKLSSWAEEAVSICEQMGIVQGSNNLFRPADSSTRAEVATVFTRLADKIG